MTKSIALHQPHPTEQTPNFLPSAEFAEMVKYMPLIAIDLLVENDDGAYLLGWRNNPPAQSCWFVPGGRIRKNEPMSTAFQRITLTELGTSFKIEHAEFKDIYQHFYLENFLGDKNQTTHYITLAYHLKIQNNQLALPSDQHCKYQWTKPEVMQFDPDIHQYTQDYFSDKQMDANND